jgi:hypothetical protein
MRNVEFGIGNRYWMLDKYKGNLLDHFYLKERNIIARGNTLGGE